MSSYPCGHDLSLAVDLFDGPSFAPHLQRDGETSTLAVPDSWAIVATTERHVSLHWPEGGWLHVRETSTSLHVWRIVNWRHLEQEQKEATMTAWRGHPVASYYTSPAGLGPRRPYTIPAACPEVAYKLVAVTDDGRLHSVYASRTAYRLGVTLRQGARPEHKGGYYSFSDRQQPLRLLYAGHLFPRASRHIGRLVLLRCSVWGRCILYGNGKQATTYLRPEAIEAALQRSPETGTWEIASLADAPEVAELLAAAR